VGIIFLLELEWAFRRGIGCKREESFHEEEKLLALKEVELVGCVSGCGFLVAADVILVQPGLGNFSVAL
jgi:hypothetical protein